MESDADLFLRKALESLESAERDFGEGRYNSCANRSYYACFQAAVAALLAEGIRPTGQWGHDFVQGQFVGLLINRRKRYRSDLRTVLPENRDLREKADYRTDPITRTQANRALGRARILVDAVKQTRMGQP
jgi:uncharacterized protein (UPF0332 family)